MRLRPTMLRLLAALALCFGVAASLAPPAAAYDVMLDASGSMEGFRRAQGGVWARLLEALERGAGRKFYFGDETESWNGPLLQVRLNHQRTRLDDALSTWLEDSRAGDAVIMVTDNVADERSEDSLQSQERFYDQLTRSDSHITHISVIPTRLKFDGSIFHPLNALPTQRYRGDRALALYLMVRDSGDDTAFRALRQTVKGVLDSLGLPYQELPIRPFGEGWSSSLGSGSIGIEARSDAPRHQCKTGRKRRSQHYRILDRR